MSCNNCSHRYKAKRYSGYVTLHQKGGRHVHTLHPWQTCSHITQGALDFTPGRCVHTLLKAHYTSSLADMFTHYSGRVRLHPGRRVHTLLKAHYTSSLADMFTHYSGRVRLHPQMADVLTHYSRRITLHPWQTCSHKNHFNFY